MSRSPLKHFPSYGFILAGTMLIALVSIASAKRNPPATLPSTSLQQPDVEPAGFHAQLARDAAACATVVCPRAGGACRLSSCD